MHLYSELNRKGLHFHYHFVCLPSGGEAVKSDGLIIINPGLVTDFPPLLECLKYMIDCTFS